MVLASALSPQETTQFMHMMDLIDKKKYQKALKINDSILKKNPMHGEMAPVQAHIRDYSGYLIMRKKILEHRCDLRNNWFGMAVAAHLCKEYELALSVLTSVHDACFRNEDSLKKWDTSHELSELLLYQAFILLDSGQYTSVLKFLNSMGDSIVDRVLYREYLAEALIQVGNLEQAKKQYRELLSMNPENSTYHFQYQKAHEIDGLSNPNCSLSDEQRETLGKIYEDLLDEHPKSDMIRLMPIFYWLEKEKVLQPLLRYMQEKFRKGVPSLWRILQPLYSRPEYGEILEDAALLFQRSLQSNGTWPNLDDPGADSGEKAPPEAIIWVYFFLSHHYLEKYDYDQSLSYINRAIEQSPNLIELYLLKAKILKKLTDYSKAAELVEQARLLDLSDRFLNNKSVKYWLRADKVDEAIKRVNLFSKTDTSTYNNVYSMQFMWFEIHLAESYYRQGDLAKALKNFTAVSEHFQEIKDQYYDFHNYCLRSMAMSSYIEVLRFGERAYGQRPFRRAAKGAILCYLKLEEQRNSNTAEAQEIPPSSAPTNGGGSLPSKSMKKPKSWNGKYDHDPHGLLLAKTSKPLEDATNYARLLSKYPGEDVESYLLSYEVYIRRNRPLLALKSLKLAIKIATCQNHQVHLKICHFLYWWVDHRHPVETVSSTIDAILQTLGITHLSNPKLYNESWLELVSDNFENRLAVAEVLLVYGDPDARPKALKLVMGLDQNHKCSLDSFFWATRLIRTYFDKAALDSFNVIAISKFPHVSHFLNPSDSSI
ncbi:uncharacterized protein LOC126316815 isoform X2 [Schistocerca gregaria]|uniref:uncharacterized protein LOC126316815 isoform X2 n=1 Tax=Schistocerca gregaria TaxID=7010 RepID=UPI00211E8368|nr:uncharacterized protein LOC126316815 isoform X2 [Schistocerca gregaria]